MFLKNADGHERTEVLIGGRNLLIDKLYAVISPYTVLPYSNDTIYDSPNSSYIYVTIINRQDEFFDTVLLPACIVSGRKLSTSNTKNTHRPCSHGQLLCYSTSQEKQEISRPVACNSCLLTDPICVFHREITSFNSFFGFGFVLIFLNYK